MKNPGSTWYEKDERYHSRNIDPLRKPERNHQEFFKDMPARGGKLLDVGMGTGNFLAQAERLGYEGHGIDFDRDAIQAAKQVFGLTRVQVATLEDTVQAHAHAFDAVTAFEVLEHLEDPSRFASQVRELLKIDGYVAVSVPYRGCPTFLKPFDLPPRHLTRWDERSMRNFFERHGFSVARVRIIPIPLAYLVTKFHFWTRRWTSMNLVEKVASKKSSSLPGEQNGRMMWLRRIARMKDYVLFSLPALLLSLWLRLIRRHGLGLYVLAQRKAKM